MWNLTPYYIQAMRQGTCTKLPRKKNPTAYCGTEHHVNLQVRGVAFTSAAQLS